ncbi:MAG: DNA adenine methylase, partial [Candidatus Gracilibacteria bacterium]|nr:DNA adenine methylase [Candidatus Gracilibacteria bacterium]MDD4530394.1 DNA adenine methylase [Candidatus Gracilibacteria bacterium]
RYFKEKGHKVIANDLQYYSYVLNKNYIGNHTDLYFAGIRDEVIDLFVGDINNYKEIVCKYLDDLPGKKGFIYKNYSVGGTVGKEFERMYFSDENALKCDAIRQKIEEWKKRNKINENEYFFLKASLLESVDKVANTTSVYGAFLKQLKKSALKPLVLKPANYFLNDHDHSVYNEDINILIKNTTHDVVYLDPPYNERQYSANYHLLETIAKYDNPKIAGKTGLRDYSKQKSSYCKKSEVLKSFDDLIQNIDAKYIFLSYNNEGLMTMNEIEEIMSKRGNYGVIKKEYKRFKADKTENRIHKENKVFEYLHYVKVN